MTLSERIRAARTAAGLTQENVAEAMGVSRQAVAKWESGQSAPSTANLIRLAELLGTSVDILTGTAEHRQPTVTVSVDRDVYAAAIVEAKKQLAAACKVQRMKHLQKASLVSLCWLALFLAGRIFCTTYSEPMTVLGWLFSTSPYRSTYLFGWLTSHDYYLWCSVISIVPALFGKYRFSFTTFAGFALGFVIGELFGAYPAGAPYGHGHYGWAIWGCGFPISAAVGMIWEFAAGKRIKESESITKT